MTEILKRVEGSGFGKCFRDFRFGLFFWLAFGVVALVLRGVRWDEDYEWAQVIIGAVSYPEGHPLLRWIGGAYSLQVYGAALVLRLTSSAVVLCGMRNLLFIWATVVPVFVLGATFSRKTYVGHVAALFVLIGVHLEFDGSYPQFLWPGMYSNGHVGTGFALLWLGLLLNRRHIAAGFLLGLLPAIHMGHVAPCYAFAAVYFGWHAWHEPKLLTRVAAAFCVGIACCAAFYLYQRGYHVPVPETGPYSSTLDSRTIWEGTVTHHDLHRSIPRGNSHLVVAALLLFGMFAWPFRWAGATTGSARRNLSVQAWAYVFALTVLAIVYGIMALHTLLGANVPYIFLGWLPYRLANLLPPILLALFCSTLFGAPEKGHKPFFGLLVSMLAIWVGMPILGGLVGGEIASRYFSTADWIFFALFGAASALLIQNTQAHQRIRWQWVALGAAVVSLGFFHQFGAACVASGITYVVGLRWIHDELSRRDVRSVFSFATTTAPSGGPRAWVFEKSRLYGAAALGCVVLFGVVRVEYENRSFLAVGDVEASLAEYLRDSNAEGAMVVAPPYQLLTQAQTGQPVMSDLALSYFIGYVPSLGPSIQKMYWDMYGIDFTSPQTAADSEEHWSQVWSRRSKEEWRGLGDVYAFDYVISPNQVPLMLPPLFQGKNETCYQVNASRFQAARSGVDASVRLP